MVLDNVRGRKRKRVFSSSSESGADSSDDIPNMSSRMEETSGDQKQYTSLETIFSGEHFFS